MFPRKREGKFSNRNLPLDFYITLLHRLVDEFPNEIIIQIGSANSSYNLSGVISGEIFYDLVNYNDDETVDMLVALCNMDMASFSIGSQSSLPKISLLCGLPSFIIGHQKKRHTIDENWINTNVGFYDLNKSSNDKYEMSDDCINECIDQIITFGKSII